MSENAVQRQFSQNPEGYVSSLVHAQGASLGRLVGVINPKAEWRMLDIATGGGHTAFAFSPLVAQAWALDLTPKMLAAARAHGETRGVTNVVYVLADGLQLPFAAQLFDLVTCRIAPHHFADVPRFLADCQRVLRPGGILGIVDNIVPGDGLKGKQARLRRLAGDYVNAFEALRDPSHQRCLSITEWQEQLALAGFRTAHEETISKRIDFAGWTKRMSVPAADQVRLKAMLLQAPHHAAEFLDVRSEKDGSLSFALTELVIIAIRSG